MREPQEQSIICHGCGSSELTGSIEREYVVRNVMEEEVEKEYRGYECHICGHEHFPTAQMV